jgi:hypothetical protein
MLLRTPWDPEPDTGEVSATRRGCMCPGIQLFWNDSVCYLAHMCMRLNAFQLAGFIAPMVRVSPSGEPLLFETGPCDHLAVFTIQRPLGPVLKVTTFQPL